MIAESPSSTTIAIVGSGFDAERWARALRGCEAVEVEHLGAIVDDDMLESLSRPHVAAIAFAAPAGDLPGAIRRAVMAHRHVFVGFPAALSSKQFTAIDELARRRERVVLFDSTTLGDENIAFVRKMTSAPGAIWRQRYLRSLRTGAGGQATIDDLAMADVATILSLAGDLPSQVGAIGPRAEDEAAANDVAMLTLVFDGGLAARIDVSQLEPEPCQRIVIACEGRSIVLDALDSRAPLQIHAAGGHRGPRRGERWAETVSERPQIEPIERAARVASHFVDAVRRRDQSCTNAGELARAALVWEAARRSMAHEGEMVPLAGAVAGARPTLQLIQGGGHAPADHAAPELTIVARGAG